LPTLCAIAKATPSGGAGLLEVVQAMPAWFSVLPGLRNSFPVIPAPANNALQPQRRSAKLNNGGGMPPLNLLLSKAIWPAHAPETSSFFSTGK